MGLPTLHLVAEFGAPDLEVVMFKFGGFLSSFVIMVGLMACNGADAATPNLPSPTTDTALAATKSEQSIVVAGGCFWGIQAVFQHVKGVISATSGYSGGPAKAAEYELVSTGETGHAESVKITYDPSQITDRKSTRLNSSHLGISYAVFCLKKKK